jgi:integrase
LVGYFGMLRMGNIVANAVGPAQNENSFLRRQDAAFDPLRPGVVWLRLRHTKTIQFRERAHFVALWASEGALCPVAALRLHVALVPAGPTAALFLQRGAPHRPPVRLTRPQMVLEMKRMLAATGVNPADFSGHSLRRGGATLAFGRGLNSHLVSMHGDWRSDAVFLYDEAAPAARLRLPQELARAAREAAVR